MIRLDDQGTVGKKLAQVIALRQIRQPMKALMLSLHKHFTRKRDARTSYLRFIFQNNPDLTSLAKSFNS